MARMTLKCENVSKPDVESKETAPLGGLIVGANATTKLDIKADVAELLVFDRALSLAEQKQIANNLRTRWRANVAVSFANLVNAAKQPASTFELLNCL
jgi:hypothetical protein